MERGIHFFFKEYTDELHWTLVQHSVLYYKTKIVYKAPKGALQLTSDIMHSSKICSNFSLVSKNASHLNAFL